MTTIGIPQVPVTTKTTPARRRTRLQDNLLVCGILAAFVYILTDVLGALRYPGYNFTTQGISELMAVGAPTQDLVNSMFAAYGVLAGAFAVGVLRESPGQRALRVTGLLLLGYAIAGTLGRYFPMYARGAANLSDSVPHVILTGVLVASMLATLGFAARAFGRRFMVYSLATLGAIIALGIASGVYGARIAAHQPTPGFGIVERVLIYAYLAWAAVLAVQLVRRHAAPAEHGAV